jgi:polysaccharide biosynthesis/export protein
MLLFRNWFIQRNFVKMERRLAIFIFIWSVALQPNELIGQSTPPSSSSAYRLMAGDSFTVLYRLTPEYNQTVVIEPNGDATLQLIGSISVGGLTLADASQLIRNRAGARLNNPEVSLELKNYDKPNFLVLGEVGAPGRFELHGQLTVADGLALAGGLKTSARHTNIILIRPINSEVGTTQLISFKALEKQKPRETKSLPHLQAGDILIVPTSKLSKIERYAKVVNAGVYYNPVAP